MELRSRQKMSIEALAVASNVPKGTLKKILGGETKDPQISSIVRIADALGTTANYLILGTVPDNKKSATPQKDVTDMLNQLICDALRSAGMLQDGDILTDRQAAFVEHIVQALILGFQTP